MKLWGGGELLGRPQELALEEKSSDDVLLARFIQ